MHLCNVTCKFKTLFHLTISWRKVSTSFSKAGFCSRSFTKIDLKGLSYSAYESLEIVVPGSTCKVTITFFTSLCATCLIGRLSSTSIRDMAWMYQTCKWNFKMKTILIRKIRSIHVQSTDLFLQWSNDLVFHGRYCRGFLRSPLSPDL